MEIREKTDAFLAQGPYAVVGASADRAKYGNKVLRCYRQHGLEVYPVHPREAEIEGLTCYRDLSRLPVTPRAVSIVTPPAITERVVEEAAAAGATWVWMQPGAESDAAIARAEQLSLGVIARGPCILVTLGFRDE